MLVVEVEAAKAAVAELLVQQAKKAAPLAKYMVQHVKAAPLVVGRAFGPAGCGKAAPLTKFRAQQAAKAARLA